MLHCDLFINQKDNMQIIKKIAQLGVFFILLSAVIQFANATGDSVKQIQYEKITTEELNKRDQDWFEKSFVETFLNAYLPLTFKVGPKENPKILEPYDEKAKREFLEETAKEEFQDYASTPKNGYTGIKILVDGKPAGALLLRLNDKEGIIYLAQFFICEEFAKKGLATHILENELRKKFPKYKRHEVLTRNQNLTAQTLNKKLGADT